MCPRAENAQIRLRECARSSRPYLFTHGIRAFCLLCTLFSIVLNSPCHFVPKIIFFRVYFHITPSFHRHIFEATLILDFQYAGVLQFQIPERSHQVFLDQTHLARKLALLLSLSFSSFSLIKCFTMCVFRELVSLPSISNIYLYWG